VEARHGFVSPSPSTRSAPLPEHQQKHQIEAEFSTSPLRPAATLTPGEEAQGSFFFPIRRVRSGSRCTAAAVGAGPSEVAVKLAPLAPAFAPAKDAKTRRHETLHPFLFRGACWCCSVSDATAQSRRIPPPWRGSIPSRSQPRQEVSPFSRPSAFDFGRAPERTLEIRKTLVAMFGPTPITPMRAAKLTAGSSGSSEGHDAGTSAIYFRNSVWTALPVSLCGRRFNFGPRSDDFSRS